METYTPGHSEAVAEFMARRTLASHGAFFVPHLRPRLSLLDCGCGPGSITVGIAAARYECYDSRELVAEHLARRLEQAGDVASASALRDWSKEKPGMFAQARVSAVARKPGEAGYDPATPTGGDDGNSKLGA